MSRCNPLPNDSKLPENQTYVTETKLSSFDIENEDIYKIIKTLDINNAHRHDEVSIRMLKLCDKSIVRPPSIIFTNCKLKISFLISGKKQVLFQFILPYISIIYQSPRLSFWVVS